MNYRIYVKQIDDYITGIETQAYLIPFTSDTGFYMGWNRIPASTDFGNAEDYDNYLSRISMIGEVMDEYIGLLRQGHRNGIHPATSHPGGTR